MKENNFSNGEWKLMNVIWEKSPCSVSEILAEVKEETGWNAAVIYVMLGRLVEREAVTMDLSKRPRRYSPLITREEAMEYEAARTLERVRKDGLGLLLSALVTGGDLTEKEKKELIAVLRKK